MLTLSQTVDLLGRRLLDPWEDEAPAEGRRQAAVALMLKETGGGPELLLIKRAHNPRDHWSGHMALPGGRREQTDATLAHTAIRETREEVGVHVPESHVLGRLDTIRPANPKLPPIDITPYVALAPEGAVVVHREREVAAHFWVPVEHLRRTGPSAIYSLDWGGVRNEFPAYPLDEHLIWGLTERILSTFLLLTTP